MNECLKDVIYLAVPLPEAILAEKYRGDFEAALALIDRHLAKALAHPVRMRLELEKDILKLLRREYGLTEENALAELRSWIPGFSQTELDALRRSGKTDCLFIDGKRMYYNHFCASLLKMDPDISAKAPDYTPKDYAFLDSVIDRMKREGRACAHIHIRQSFRLLPQSVVPGVLLRVHLPIPAGDASVSNLTIHRLSPEGAYVAAESHPQRTAYFETVAQEGQIFSVEYAFDSEMYYRDISKLLNTGDHSVFDRDVPAKPSARAIGANGDMSAKPGAGAIGANGSMPAEPSARAIGANGDISAKQRTRVNSADDDMPLRTKIPEKVEDGYLRECLSEQAPQILFTPFLRMLAAEISGDEHLPLRIARRFYDYITQKIEYAFIREYASIENIAEYCALRGKGDCGAQSLLFIALCRIAGIPAAWQSGIGAEPNDVGDHDWARFYAEPFGWLYVDCAYGNIAWHKGALSRWDFYFGNVDPYRIIVNQALQQNFDPPKAFMRADPYDNQCGEAEYTDRGVAIDGFECTREVIDIR